MTRRPRVPWGLTALLAVLLLAVTRLGLWQLDRASEKEALEIAYLATQSSPPVDLDSAQPFSRVRVSGRYDEPRYLLDNQVREGVVGYWSLQRFVLSDGRALMVNRGWLPAPERRSELPDPPAPSEPVTLIGMIWPQLGLPPLLEEEEWSARWPERVQRRDIERMAAATGSLAIELRLVENQPGALATIDMTPTFGRETHMGYAVQWFALGGVIVIGWLVLWRRGAKET